MSNSINLAKAPVNHPALSPKFYSSVWIVTSLAVFMFLGSCKKDSVNNDSTAATDHAIAEGESNRVIQAVYTTAYENNVQKPAGEQELDTIFPSCAVITIDTSNSTRNITIDFGSSPCQCVNWDGKFRQGKIIASWTGMYRDSGTVITIITQDYYQGVLATKMNKFDFNKTVINMGHNANGNLHYAINVSAATITFYSGETVTWTSQRDREWTAGEGTWLPFDDVYSITGTASGVDRNAIAFSVSITGALIIKLNCPWISQGTLEIVHGNLPTATVDYGDGTCDNDATITINGVTTPFSL